ncbi:MAG: heavy metal translocating P-type ATPase [Daejeonella sp.]
MKTDNNENTDLLNAEEIEVAVKETDTNAAQTELENKSEHPKDHATDDGHDHDHEDHDHGSEGGWISQWQLLVALAGLIIMLTLDYGFHIRFSKIVELPIYIALYLLSGYKVLDLAFRKAKRLDFFNEFFLMSVATIGAFLLGSYSEGVAVMVFYSIGEFFQELAVNRAKTSIKALLDVRPETVMRLNENNKTEEISSYKVKIGDIIQVKAGEKVGLDGILISDKAVFNTAALTGESKPDSKEKGDRVLAGMINLDSVSEVKVDVEFTDSKLSRILSMVQDATARKSQTQLFISRFAKIYTPVVFGLAFLLVLLPYFFVSEYNVNDWLYRSLVFLVISCPCALVVSIPLGYFGGIGLASKTGILFKGANYLDVMAKVDTIVMDKTGTLTKGIFEVQKVHAYDLPEDELLKYAGAIEAKSTHPIAKAVLNYAGDTGAQYHAEDVQEVAGMGLKGTVNGKIVLAGNARLLKKFNVAYDSELDKIDDTIVVISVDGKYAGYILIADELKDDAKIAVENMHNAGLKTVMLSGDKQSVVDNISKLLKIDQAFGGLLPEDKVNRVSELKNAGRHIAFVGDGLNDAPVLALADAGIAMGGLGSDASIEIADVVIQNDQPSKILSAIRIGKITKKIVWQNIFLAMSVKIIVLALGAGGIANLWEAVIADVGVALLAILNAVRIQHIKL